MNGNHHDYRMSQTFDSVSSGSVLYMNDTLSDSESVQLLPSDTSGFSDITRFSLPDSTFNESIALGSSYGRQGSFSMILGPEFITVKKPKHTSQRSIVITDRINLSSDQDQRVCPICDISMKAVNLYRHLRRSHRWTEEQIDMYKMQIRRKKYEGKKLFECSSCPAIYTSAATLKEHQKTYGCSDESAYIKVQQIAEKENAVFSVNDISEAEGAELSESQASTSTHATRMSSGSRCVDINRVAALSESINECTRLRNRLAAMEMDIVATDVTNEVENKLEKIIGLYKTILATKGNCEIKEIPSNGSTEQCL